MEKLLQFMMIILCIMLMMNLILYKRMLMNQQIGRTNLDLIKELIKNNVIKSKEVVNAMERTDRKFYAPYSPYYDSPQSIGYGATISAPHMHGYALQYLKDYLVKAKNVLDVGSGTGYLTAAMALMTPKDSHVFGVQHVPQLVQKSLKNIQNDNPQLLKEKITIKIGDGRLGWVWNDDIQFDVIHVGAAPQQVPPALIKQLAEGGRMVIPVGKNAQEFVALDKIDGKLKKTHLLGVRYVPLTDLKSQLNS